MSKQETRDFAVNLLMMMESRSKDTQEQKILHHLIYKGPITPIEALNLYGSFRLGARIHDLREMGVAIESTKIKTLNGAWVSEYRLGGDEDVVQTE